MTIRKRIDAFLNSKKLSHYQAEKILDLSKGYMNKCSNPSYQVLHNMCRIYPELSAEWLLRGEGEMFRKIEPEAPSCAAQEILTQMKALNNKIDSMSSQIEELKKTDARPDEDVTCAAVG